MDNSDLLTEAQNLILDAQKIDIFGTQDKIVDKANFLKDKYPDYNDYRLYHLMIGSTPEKVLPFFDFPGEDSIMNFLRTL